MTDWRIRFVSSGDGVVFPTHIILLAPFLLLSPHNFLRVYRSHNEDFKEAYCKKAVFCLGTQHRAVVATQSFHLRGHFEQNSTLDRHTSTLSNSGCFAHSCHLSEQVNSLNGCSSHRSIDGARC